MASDYLYFLTALPTLKLSGEGAPAWAEFIQLCKDRLNTREAEVLERLQLLPNQDPQDLDIPVIRQWYDWVTVMGNGVATRRARLLKLDGVSSRRPENDAFPSDSKRLEAVLELSSARLRQEGWEALLWSHLDGISASEGYSFAALIVYALKLRLLERRRKYDAAEGAKLFEELIAACEAGAKANRQQLEQ